MRTRQEIISALSPIMRASYRTLMESACKLKGIVVWSTGSGYEDLELIYPDDLLNEAYMQNRVILFDGRR